MRRRVIVRLLGAAVGADLGSSSKHSLENVKVTDGGLCGEGFLVNCSWTRVNRS